MQPAALFCVLVFTACWVIYVQSQNICGKNQYTVTYSDGSFYKCLNCATCHPGYGLYPPCGTSVTYPANNIDCEPCPNGTFSNALDSAPCQSCQHCVEHEIIAAPCTKDSDRKCNGTCEKGYFFAKKAPHDCQQCSYCCFDGKDDKQPECMKQGLNATGRHCSGRLDKQCGPPSTTAVTTTVTHSPPVTHPSSQHQNTTVTDLPPTTHPSNQHQNTTLTHLPPTTHPPNQHQNTTSSGLDNVISPTHPSSKHSTAAIVLGVLCGLLSVALVVGAIAYKRKKRIWRRKIPESNQPSNQINIEADDSPRDPTQGNYDSNASQRPQSANPTIQALQNTGYIASSPSATPEVSPSATPQQTDDELEPLPDVVAVRQKRLLKRQSSKDAQNHHAPDNEGATKNLEDSIVDVNDGNFKGQDSKGGGQTKPRKGSLEAVKRKFSFSQEKNDYQPLGAEDPDEPQGNGETGSKSRSGPTLSFKTLKRKLSLSENVPDYQPVRREDPDEHQSDCENFSTTCNEPVIIKVEPRRQKQEEGSRVEFKCIVKGKSEVFYQWIKDGTEMLGQNDSSLVFSSVQLHDFGCYVCEVSFADSQCDCKRSSAAMLDVDPRDGMGLKLLGEVDLGIRDDIATYLEDKTSGLGGWRQIAYKYEMEEHTIRGLENSQQPGREVMEFLRGSKPDLTVYRFCKTLKEDKMKRLDIVNVLENHFTVKKESK